MKNLEKRVSEMLESIEYSNNQGETKSLTQLRQHNNYIVERITYINDDIEVILRSTVSEEYRENCDLEEIEVYFGALPEEFETEDEDDLCLAINWDIQSLNTKELRQQEVYDTYEEVENFTIDGIRDPGDVEDEYFKIKNRIDNLYHIISNYTLENEFEEFSSHVLNSIEMRRDNHGDWMDEEDIEDEIESFKNAKTLIETKRTIHDLQEGGYIHSIHGEYDNIGIFDIEEVIGCCYSTADYSDITEFLNFESHYNYHTQRESQHQNEIELTHYTNENSYKQFIVDIDDIKEIHYGGTEFSTLILNGENDSILINEDILDVTRLLDDKNIEYLILNDNNEVLANNENFENNKWNNKWNELTDEDFFLKIK